MRREGGGQGESGCRPQQGIVHHRERRGPFLQEFDARIDHGGAQKQGECQYRIQRADNQRQVHRERLTEGEQYRVPTGIMDQPVQRRHAHECR